MEAYVVVDVVLVDDENTTETLSMEVMAAKPSAMLPNITIIAMAILMCKRFHLRHLV